MRAQMRSVAVAFLSFATGGCAFITRQVKLEQPVRTATPLAMCIEVEKISDARPEPQKVGVTRNGFYIATADARTDDDVAQWVSDYLRQALVGVEANTCQEPVVLTGTVKEAFVNEYWNLDGRLVVLVRLERKKLVLLEREFEGRYKQPSHGALNSEYAETLREALADFGRSAIPAIVAAADPPTPTSP